MPDLLDNILLLSPNGMLGRAWDALLRERGLAYRTASHADFDLCDADSIERVITPGTTLVVNCAAYTQVDKAEEEEALATAINGQGVGDLAARCEAVGAMLIHFGTDYVFSGNATAPYPIDTPREPLNAYGRSKAVGEAALEASGCRYLNIRTSWLYAPWGNNFVLTMAKLTAERDALKVVDDQRGRPTSCQHLAAATLALAEAGATGHHHVSDDGECTWHEFTTEIAAQLGNTCDIAPCGSDEDPRPAKRPAYSVLDLNQTEALIGPQPHWRDNLKDVLTTLQATAH